MRLRVGQSKDGAYHSYKNKKMGNHSKGEFFITLRVVISVVRAQVVVAGRDVRQGHRCGRCSRRLRARWQEHDRPQVVIRGQGAGLARHGQVGQQVGVRPAARVCRRRMVRRVRRMRGMRRRRMNSRGVVMVRRGVQRRVGLLGRARQDVSAVATPSVAAATTAGVAQQGRPVVPAQRTGQARHEGVARGLRGEG